MSGTLALLRHRPVWFSLTLLVLVISFWLWTAAEATEKLRTAGLNDGTGAAQVVVTLAMVPEKFHMEVLQDAGRMVLVEGRQIELRDVSDDALRSIARRYWIAEIAPIDAEGKP